MAHLYERNDAYNPSKPLPYSSDPPVYNGNRMIINERIKEVQPIDCKPRYCYSPYAVLRWIELALLFTLHWLVEVVCDSNACTMILNEFGYKAHGQMYVVMVLVLIFCTTICIMVAYSMNIHNATPQTLVSIEKVHTIVAILLMVPAAIIGSYYAGCTVDSFYNEMGRGQNGIRPQWIAAACLEWVTVLVLVFDLIGQMTVNYPQKFVWT